MLKSFLIFPLIFSLCLSFEAVAKEEKVNLSFEKKLSNWSHATKGNKVKHLNAFYELYWDYLMTSYPEWATFVGYSGQNDRWSDMSLEAIAKQKNVTKLVLAALNTVTEDGLKGEDLLSFRLAKYRLEEEIENFKFPTEYLAIDQMGGIHSELVDILTVAPKRNNKDYDDMLSRLQTADVIIEQTMILLREGLKKGITQPRVTLVSIPNQIDRLLTAKIDDSPIFKAFLDVQQGALSAEQTNLMQSKARDIIAKSIFPSLKKLRDYLVKEYIPNCREAIGWSALPDGQNWYNARIKSTTTTNLNSEEIFQLGQKEVLRIRAEMDKVREGLNFKGDFNAFNKSLKDSKFYFTKGEDLLERFRSIGKSIDPELPKYFNRLPRLTYGVKEMETFKAPNSPAAYYEGGSLEAGRSGNFIANTFDLNARPKWGMIDLTCHEAVPGHHLQISIAQEIDGFPEFRKNMSFTAFVEGWGLYSETLCGDMGLYKDPYDKYGQLTAEMWRAVRLVVDTGIHAKGWSRDQAVEYFRNAGPFAEQEIQSETNRYIVWAGQALAYKIGQLKILELREKAKTTMGDKYDIRKFHDQVLGSGALPLAILDKKVSEWIASSK